jgi:hypothetical protein
MFADYKVNPSVKKHRVWRQSNDTVLGQAAATAVTLKRHDEDIENAEAAILVWQCLSKLNLLDSEGTMKYITNTFVYEFFVAIAQQ